MKKLLISCILIFLSLNINAAISQSGITNLKQLDKNGIIDLVSGNQLTGFISDGPFEGSIKQTYFKDGRYETIYDDRVFKGKWRAEGESYATPQGKKMCTKNNNATDWSCFYWYTGNKDGGTYAYIIAQGLIFHQYHEIKSVIQIKAEAKKEAQRKKVADAKRAEEKKKAAERKRVADAKKAEEKKKAAERKRVADAKKEDEKKRVAKAKKKVEEEKKRVADAKRAEEKKRNLAKIAEQKRVADEKLKNALSLLPPKTKLQNAQNFIIDIDEFVAKNPNELDIMEVAMFKINTKLISEGTSDNQQMKTLELFRDSVESSTAFLKFQKKKKDAKNQQEIKKITKLMNSIEGRINQLQEEINKGSSSKILLAKISSAQSILRSPDSFSVLQVLNKELIQLINDIANQKKIESKIKFESITLDQHIDKLKTYLTENISSISSEFMTLIVGKVNILENTKKQKFTNNTEEKKVLIKVNDDIADFILNNNLLTDADIAATKKQAEDKKKSDAKKKADKKKAEERKRKADAKKKADAKERERLKNFKTVKMNCSYSINGQYLNYSWAYDGKKLYWEGIPVNIGTNNLDQGMSIKVKKLSGKDRFQMEVLMLFIVYDFTNDFYNKDSEINFYGIKGFGTCY